MYTNGLNEKKTHDRYKSDLIMHLTDWSFFVLPNDFFYFTADFHFAVAYYFCHVCFCLSFFTLSWHFCFALAFSFFPFFLSFFCFALAFCFDGFLFRFAVAFPWLSYFAVGFFNCCSFFMLPWLFSFFVILFFCCGSFFVPWHIEVLGRSWPKMLLPGPFKWSLLHLRCDVLIEFVWSIKLM